MSQVRVSQLALLVLAMACLAMTFQTSNAQNYPKDWVDAHNAVRSKARVGPLVWDNALASFALNHVSFWAKVCILQHSDSPPGGENIALNFNPSAKNIVDAWVKSPSHYANLVSPKWTRIGCASVRCTGKSDYIISCNYGPPAKMNTEMLYSEDIYVM